MKHLWLTLTLIAGMNMAHAAETVEHFTGLPANTLTEAMHNFVTYNAKLNTVLNSEPLTHEAMAQAHELTYTLENALAKIHQATEQLQVILEEVHIATERFDTATLQQQSALYLELAQQLGVVTE